MKEIVKTSRLAGQLEKLFNKLNADFFSGELETPVITIQSTPRAYGHYSLSPLWEVKDGAKHEINIGAGTLDRPIEETVATLLHEMVHMYDDTILNVQDCSGSSRMYHNKMFRRTAESHGLICTHTRYGWSHTEPADTLIEWILENDIQEIKLNRNEPHGIRIAGGNAAANGGAATTSTTSKGHSIRYKCPVCGQLARTTKTARLICGDCMLPMLES